MWEKLKSIGRLLASVFKEWSAADPFRQSAIISYYAIFSIPGLLIIVIWIAGFFLGEEAVRGEISSQVGELMGAKAANGVEDIIRSSSLEQSNLFMKIVGIGALVFGSTGLFYHLQRSLNYVWDVEAAPENDFLKFLYDRVYSLGLILVIAFLLLITLVLSALISILARWIEQHFGETLLYFVQLVNFLISLGIVTLLFAMMYKVLPDVDIGWKSVWVGALVTAVLFSIGKTLLGLYFGYADPSSSFGAAGTVILVMLWVNYTCLILFFGAQFTQTFARRYGHEIKPSKHARWSPRHILGKEECGDSTQLK